MQTSSAADALRLEVRADAGEGAVRISYGLTNQSRQTMVAYDGAAGTGDGEFPDLTGRCYVSYAEGVCSILRIRPPTHPFSRTDSIFIPPASVVEPGQTRRVQFRLPLPVKERAEYSPDYPGAKYAPHTVRSLELRIGYFWKAAETVLKPLPIADAWKVVKGAPLVETYQVAKTCPASFEMLVRTDPEFLRMQP